MDESTTAGAHIPNESDGAARPIADDLDHTQAERGAESTSLPEENKFQKAIAAWRSTALRTSDLPVLY